MIVSAYAADPNGVSFAGETYVVFGSNATPALLNPSTLNGSNGFVINGVATNDASGRVVESVGDINGDGIDDVALSSSSADPNGIKDAGTTYVVFGSTNPSSSVELSSLDSSNGFSLNGIDSQDFSGSSLSGAGDVNGDGIDDLIIGAKRAATIVKAKRAKAMLSLAVLALQRLSI